jgi:hypothetical protein
VRVLVNTVAQRIDEGANKEIAVVSMVNIDHCAFMSLSFNEGHELSYYADVALGEGFFLAVSLSQMFERNAYSFGAIRVLLP